MQSEEASEAIRRKCDEIKEMLVAKSRAYGASALAPVRIFSRSNVDEQLKVRIDDKLSRLAKGDPTAFGEEPVVDLVGYLILLLIHMDRQTSEVERNKFSHQ